MYHTHACSSIFFLFFFNDTATTEIYTLSLHDALPICPSHQRPSHPCCADGHRHGAQRRKSGSPRSEEHTSELQSRLHLVCRLLLEKKKKNRYAWHTIKRSKTDHAYRR